MEGHRGHRELTVWKERVFRVCSGVWYSQSFDNGVTTLHSTGHVVGIQEMLIVCMRQSVILLWLTAKVNEVTNEAGSRFWGLDRRLVSSYAC